MKKFSFLLLISIIFFTGCSLDFSIPNDNPPIIDMSEWTMKNDIKQDNKQDIKAEEITISEDATYNVVIPSDERETQRLLEEYQATLDALDKSIK